MWFVFAIQLISVLLRFQSVMSYSCYKADWGSSLDRIGWSKCPKTNTYLKGLDRNVAQPGDERVGRIEYGECCTATAHSGYTDQPATCSNANWRDTLNRYSVWALCPTGYYLNGLRLGAGPPAYLNDIDEGQCCHPQNHPNSYEHCYDEDVSSSFDKGGLSSCKQEGYYMTGFYKSVCKYIYCIEKFKCCKMKKVIDGGWSDWGNFGECSVTCGDGTKARTRTCTNPPPSGGGANCSGPSTDTVPCNEGPCVVDGGWSDFGDWSECTAECGKGITVRRRTCTNPPPSNGGECCTGDNLELEFCNAEPCEGQAVNGKWSKWSAFSKCSKTCGKGRKTRTRTCSNPPPSGGGKNCKGKAKKSRKCKLGKCRGYGKGKGKGKYVP